MINPTQTQVYAALMPLWLQTVRTKGLVKGRDYFRKWAVMIHLRIGSSLHDAGFRTHRMSPLEASTVEENLYQSWIEYCRRNSL